MAEDQNSELEAGTNSISRRTFLYSAALSALFFSPLGASAQLSAVPEFSFAFVPDVHLATGLPDSLRLLQESQLFLQDAVKSINEEGVDFVIFGGDQVESPGKDDSYWQLFIDVVANLQAPWYFILGESDVSGTAVVDKMRTFGPDLKGRGAGAGKTYWSLDPVQGVHLIGLDTANANSETGRLSRDQLNWLKQDLQSNRGKFTVVASHHPLLAPAPYDSGPPWDEFIVEQGAEAREILGASRDVRLCLSGHIPVNKIQKERDIWYASCPSLAVYPCQFKIFRVSPRGIAMETLPIRYDALVKKAKKILSGSRVAFQYSTAKPLTFLKVAEGSDLDRFALLPLTPGAVAQPQKGHRKKPGKATKKDTPQAAKKETASPEKPKAEKTKAEKTKTEKANPPAPSENKPPVVQDKPPEVIEQPPESKAPVPTRNNNQKSETDKSE